MSGLSVTWHVRDVFAADEEGEARGRAPAPAQAEPRLHGALPLPHHLQRLPALREETHNAQVLSLAAGGALLAV